MIRIINLSNRTLDVTDTISINPRSHLNVQTSITPRLYQLMNMGLIRIEQINEKNTDDSDCISSGSLRRKQMMNKIRNGQIKSSVSLDISSYKKTTDTKNLTRRKKVKNK